MKIKYLLDENLSPEYRTQLLYHQADLEVVMIGDDDTLPKGTKDPEILCWCEENGYILVTNNRASMPMHLADHLAQNRHVPGIFVFRSNSNMGLVIDNLIIIAGASFAGDHQDQIIFIPL